MEHDKQSPGQSHLLVADSLGKAQASLTGPHLTNIAPSWSLSAFEPSGVIPRFPTWEELNDMLQMDMNKYDADGKLKHNGSKAALESYHTFSFNGVKFYYLADDARKAWMDKERKSLTTDQFIELFTPRLGDDWTGKDEELFLASFGERIASFAEKMKKPKSDGRHSQGRRLFQIAARLHHRLPGDIISCKQGIKMQSREKEGGYPWTKQICQGLYNLCIHPLFLQETSHIELLPWLVRCTMKQANHTKHEKRPDQPTNLLDNPTTDIALDHFIEEEKRAPGSTLEATVTSVEGRLGRQTSLWMSVLRAVLSRSFPTFQNIEGAVTVGMLRALHEALEAGYHDFFGSPPMHIYPPLSLNSRIDESKSADPVLKLTELEDDPPTRSLNGKDAVWSRSFVKELREKQRLLAREMRNLEK